MRTLANPNTVAAYLYLHLAEQMPSDADDDWFLSPEPNPVRMVDVQSFLAATTSLRNQLLNLEVDDEDSYQTLFYDAAKATFGGDKGMIRTYFMWLYLILFQSENGPRWGVFVRCVGRDRFVQMMDERFNSLF